MRAALYARVSTADQSCEPQLRDLRQYVAARGWDAVEYVDQGVSGAKDRRPALDRLLAAVKARKVDVVVVAAFDRFGRSSAIWSRTSSSSATSESSSSLFVSRSTLAHLSGRRCSPSSRRSRSSSGA